MKRPHLVHFLAIESQDKLNIRALVSYVHRKGGLFFEESDEEFDPTSPWESLGLLQKREFLLKIVGHDAFDKEIFRRTYESDSFGGLNLKIPLSTQQRITHLQIFELNSHPGMEMHLGSFIPLKLPDPLKLIISDFDKTLVDTRWSSAKELYTSLRRPLEYFPSVSKSIQTLKDYTQKGHQPFLVTSSPHFYENAIRDWLYQNKIYTAGIFLKDYRHFFSIFEGDLTPKDLKSQGFYKLNHLVTILLMTGVPSELVLMGDGFESDPTIYLTLAVLLKGQVHPWRLWNNLRSSETFRLNNKQNSRFLNKIYQLDHLIKKNARPEVKILIRKFAGLGLKELPKILHEHQDLLEFYEA